VVRVGLASPQPPINGGSQHGGSRKKGSITIKIALAASRNVGDEQNCLGFPPIVIPLVEERKEEEGEEREREKIAHA
jgi:hypothetical protein